MKTLNDPKDVTEVIVAGRLWYRAPNKPASDRYHYFEEPTEEASRYYVFSTLSDAGRLTGYRVTVSILVNGFFPYHESVLLGKARTMEEITSIVDQYESLSPRSRRARELELFAAHKEAWLKSIRRRRVR